MSELLTAIGTHVKTSYEAQYDPERTLMQSDALRIFGNDHPTTRQWVEGKIPDTEFHAKAIKRRTETARALPRCPV